MHDSHHPCWNTLRSSVVRRTLSTGTHTNGTVWNAQHVRSFLRTAKTGQHINPNVMKLWPWTGVTFQISLVCVDHSPQSLLTSSSRLRLSCQETSPGDGTHPAALHNRHLMGRLLWLSATSSSSTATSWDLSRHRRARRSSLEIQPRQRLLSTGNVSSSSLDRRQNLHRMPQRQMFLPKPFAQCLQHPGLVRSSAPDAENMVACRLFG